MCIYMHYLLYTAEESIASYKSVYIGSFAPKIKLKFHTYPSGFIAIQGESPTVT